MGLLDSLLGSPKVVDEDAEDEEPTIDISREDYDIAYPVAVRRSRLQEFRRLIQTERDTPLIEGPMADTMKEALNDAWQNTMPNDQTWEEGIEETRDNAEDLIEEWLEHTSGDLNVIFVPVGATRRLRAFLVSCEARDDNEKDSFTLPEESAEAVSLLKKLQNATDEKDPVFVHRDQYPSSLWRDYNNQPW
ncbi:hypothetical protein ACFQDG_08725 [Natronoarchaeum mannanilyticum]|uniref:Uncharacterized protein n=1 Tax=Natronoarchaeum mannanilyticum TaxID=926360 RepID=A0AAV3T9S5_9EURY